MNIGDVHYPPIDIWMERMMRDPNAGPKRRERGRGTVARDAPRRIGLLITGIVLVSGLLSPGVMAPPPASADTAADISALQQQIASLQNQIAQVEAQRQAIISQFNAAIATVQAVIGLVQTNFPPNQAAALVAQLQASIAQLQAQEQALLAPLDAQLAALEPLLATAQMQLSLLLTTGGGGSSGGGPSPATTPELDSVVLFAAGALALVGYGWHQRRKAHAG